MKVSVERTKDQKSLRKSLYVSFLGSKIMGKYLKYPHFLFAQLHEHVTGFRLKHRGPIFTKLKSNDNN